MPMPVTTQLFLARRRKRRCLSSAFSIGRKAGAVLWTTGARSRKTDDADDADEARWRLHVNSSQVLVVEVVEAVEVLEDDRPVFNF